MGLICNGYRNGLSPFRTYAGATVSYLNGRAPANDYRTGRLRNIAFLTSRQVALPQGNLAPSAWMLPQTGGGMSMRTVGAGTLAAGLIPSYPMSIDLTGAGDLDATAGLVVSMLLAMAGAGDLTATIEGRLNASIDMTGSGDLDANLSGLGNMVVELLGAGDLDATIAAFGDMTIDIVVTGTGLSTANVGQAVWGALAAANNVPNTMGEKLNDAGSASNPWTEVIESGYTAAEILRLLAAYAAGKTTVDDLGGGFATVTFRDLGDTKDRIVGDMAGSERTDVTKDVT